MNIRQTLLTAFAALSATAGSAAATELMVPLYSWPSAWTEGIADCAALPDPDDRVACDTGKGYWARWQAVAATCAAGDVPVSVIVDPADGPGPLADGDPCDSPGSDWARGLELLEQSGCHVLGYVATDYLRRDPNTLWTEAQAYYGACRETGAVDGLFFDEYKGFEVTAADVQLTGLLATYLGWFMGFDLVLNPGTPPQWAAGEAPAGRQDDNPYADVNLRAVVTVENTPAGYAAVDLPDWQLAGDPADHALLLHGVDPLDRAGLLALMDQAWRDGFGHVFLTDGADEHIWSVQPAFWDDLVGKATSLRSYGDWSGDPQAVLGHYCAVPGQAYASGQCGGQPLIPGFCIVIDPYSPYYYGHAGFFVQCDAL